MNPRFALVIAAGWLKSSYLTWAAIVLATMVALAIVFFIIRKHRSAAVALIRHPFAKYVIFSIVAHLALAAWLWTSHWFDVTPMPPGAAMIIVDVGADENEPEIEQSKPWDPPQTEVATGPVPELPEQPSHLPDVERPDPSPAFDNRVDSPLASMETLIKDVPDTLRPFADAPKPPVELPTEMTNLDSTAAVAAPAEVITAEPEPIEPVESQFSADEGQQVATLDEHPNTANDETATLSRDMDEPQTSEVQSQTETSTNQIPPMKVAETPPKAKLQPRLQPLPVSTSRTDQTSASHRSSAASRPIKRRADGKTLPAIYRDRWAGDRMFVARSRGGSEDTEAAVRAALVWLSQAQGVDGRWDASQFGSGRPVREGGHDRGNAGVNADTATTGLALLAFLGSGHTHLEGKYADNVRRGLGFLVRAQQTRTDGSLVGQATPNAAMYCHGIATLALSEAYSLTGDVSLRRPLSDAISFTLNSQHPGGGWRYRPQEPGDTSQLGWQLMAITSAHYAGYAKTISKHPNDTWGSASRFLDSVAWGNHGGLASYKPNQRPTRAMTAEALLCRLLLNTPTDHPRTMEAADHLMAELPGQGRLNYYYWYYGTLGLYHLQDDHWRRWNSALTRQLTSLQLADGSWPSSNSVWGNAGGTVYTTAIAAMTLEVYYRYRPFSEAHRVDLTARRP